MLFASVAGRVDIYASDPHMARGTQPACEFTDAEVAEFRNQQGTNDSGDSSVFDVYRAADAWHVRPSYD